MSAQPIETTAAATRARSSGAPTTTDNVSAYRIHGLRPTASSLDDAIAEADAFMPEYRRLRIAVDAAEESAVRWDKRLEQKATAARDAIPMPQEICFPIAPEDQLVKMELTYANGAVRTVDHLTQGYTPKTRAELEEHCQRRKLDVAHFGAIWDAWKAEQDEAARSALPQEYHLAEARYREADDAWGEAVDKREALALAILKTPVLSSREAVAKIDAYVRFQELGSVEDAFDEDKAMMLNEAVRALRTLADMQRLIPGKAV